MHSAPNVVSENDYGNQTYAIILSGGVNKNANSQIYWNDCSFIYQTLVNKYGIPKNHIYPIMADGEDPAVDMRGDTMRTYISQNLDLDGDQIQDIYLAATCENVENTLNEIKSKIKRNGHLFIFVSDHGGSEDNNLQSYICLWKNDILHDYQLAEWLKPFQDKSTNISVVMGQCYSGGFIDDLTQVGCVIATVCPGNVPAFAGNIENYTEFLYYWTCAVNEMDSNGENKVFSDYDGNGRVTMEEAFRCAKENTNPDVGKSQYNSNPRSIGEDLALNHIPLAVDIYIKDNEEDTGKEINTSTDKSWISPSIWVRNEKDGVENHQTPIFSSENDTAYVYTQILNRGKSRYTGSQWLHVYWAKASTAYSEDTWQGKECLIDISGKSFPTGGHITPIEISRIEPNDTLNVVRTWTLPADFISSLDPEHGFCLKARILNTPIDEEYDHGNLKFEVLNNNDEAEKGLIIRAKNDYGKVNKVYMRNPGDKSAKFKLELAPRTSMDVEVFKLSDVYLELSDNLFAAWKAGGYKSTGLDTSNLQANSINPKYIECTSSQVVLENINLKAKEVCEVGVKFDFIYPSHVVRSYKYDIMQRDEYNKILGGVAIEIVTPFASELPMDIISDTTEDNQLRLYVKSDRISNISWRDENNHLLGNRDSILLKHNNKAKQISAIGFNDDGDIARDSVLIQAYNAIKDIEVNKGSHLMTVKFASPVKEGSTISIVSIDGNSSTLKFDLPTGISEFTINTESFGNGIYAITYYYEEEKIGQSKIKIL